LAKTSPGRKADDAEVRRVEQEPGPIRWLARGKKVFSGHANGAHFIGVFLHFRDPKPREQALT
jgi:hypothetical protein